MEINKSFEGFLLSLGIFLYAIIIIIIIFSKPSSLEADEFSSSAGL